MWPFKRRQDPKADQSTIALAAAQASMQTITDRHQEVLKVTGDLRRIRKENHFSDHLTRIMKEGQK
jgi:enamine deaminase RidA (YjgF/YER057c/UK114 family)